ncbi:MAG: HAD family hydrolase [Sedimentisphaerales bacterium]|nr:HAD family hydrolase [Sedimentisphaerales bacterium]
MSQRRIQAILFDLGETLICFGPIKPGPLFHQAAEKSYAYLKSLGQPVGGFFRYYWANLIGLRVHIFWSLLTSNDFDALAALKRTGQQKGFNLTDEQWEELHFRWYEPLFHIARFENDLRETLNRLSETLKLGIVSNTFVHASALERHMEHMGVLHFFQPRLYSYDFPFRKPDKRIFLEAARQIDAAPEAILYVGDRINKDVLGAMAAGMAPVLITAHTNRGKRIPQGTYQIDRLAELPSLVEKINGKR